MKTARLLYRCVAEFSDGTEKIHGPNQDVADMTGIIALHLRDRKGNTVLSKDMLVSCTPRYFTRNIRNEDGSIWKVLHCIGYEYQGTRWISAIDPTDGKTVQFAEMMARV